MLVTKLSDLPLKSTPLGGGARVLLENEHVRVVNLILQPGEEVASHYAEAEVLFIGLEGAGILQLQGQSIVITAGSMAVCPAGLSRSVSASPDQSISLLVVRSPNPDFS